MAPNNKPEIAERLEDSDTNQEVDEQLENKLVQERRQFLQSIGAAGIAGLGISQSAGAQPTDNSIDPEAYEESPALPPNKAMETFKLTPGYEIELVASEPLLHNPVDIKWDEEGRLWVIEMPDFMTSVEGDSPGPSPPNGRVSVLEDTDGDGKMDKSHTFLDGLSLPRTIGFVEDGVLVADETELTLYQDTTGDLTPDKQEVLIEDFVDPENVEHTDNGLQFMMDNWMYNAKSDLRVQYRDGSLNMDKTHNRGQWGITQDTYGRLFYNHNSIWLFGDLVSGDYLLRGSSEATTGIGEELVGDRSIYTVHENYGTNRAYRDGFHRPDGRMKNITAACGPCIYRGDLFDEEAVNQAFIPDPAGNVVGRFDIQEDGLDLQAEHITYDDEKWGQREFLASSDEVFRPTYAKTGPDGALYIVDMYQGILQHEVYLTDYLKDYILKNNLHKVPPAGRIYRVVPQDNESNGKSKGKGKPNHAGPSLADKEPAALAASLADPNGWKRDTAQRLIVQQALTEAAPMLRKIARDTYDGRREGPPSHADEQGKPAHADGQGPPAHANNTHDIKVGPVARMHALWALHGIDEIDAETVFSAMETDNTHLGTAAMRTGEALLGTEYAEDYVDRLIEFANADPLRLVVQAAYSLGEVSDSELESRAEDTLNQLLDRYGQNQFVIEAVNSSLADEDDDVNQSPTASFTVSSSTVSPGDSVTFDASESDDSDGSISSYKWEFGNGATATGQSVSHTYDSTGEYTVTLTVTDDDDASASATATITVSDSSDGSEALDPSTTIELDGDSGGWVGTAPSSIDGTTNPTLSLAEGKEYTVKWTNVDGAVHDFAIDDSNGNEIVSTDFVSEEGATATLTFTVSTDMATYICNAHPLAMVGDIEVI